MNAGLQRYQIARMLENVGIDEDTVDLEAHVDEELNLYENISNVESEIGRPVITGEDPNTDEVEGMQRENDQKLLDGEEYKELYMEQKWLEIIEPQSMNLIAGAKRKGKSVLAYWLAEQLHKKHDLNVYVYGLPEAKWHLLPEFTDPLTTLDLPEDSIIIFDEAYREFHSRTPLASDNKQIDTIAGLVGQKNIISLYITQQTRKLDIGIVGVCDSIMWKKPSLLQMKFERAQFRKDVEGIYNKFKELPKTDVKKNTYIISEDFEGFLTNPMSDWWTEDLSTAYRGISLVKEIKGGQLEKEDSSKLLLFFNGGISEFSRVIAAEVSEGQYGFDHIAEFDIVEGSEGYICSQGGKSFFGLIELVEKLREKGIECIVDTRVEITKIK